MNFQETLFPGYTIGEDAYQNIPAVCAPFGKKAAIIGGKRALAAAEEKIRRAVAGSAVEITGTYWYGGEASVENIAKLQPQVAQADMLFAVGGGKAIDTVKVLAHMTHRPGLHQPGHFVPPGRQPAGVLLLQNPAQSHLHRPADYRRRPGEVPVGRHGGHHGQAL